jgi:hypothetical protein
LIGPAETFINEPKGSDIREIHGISVHEAILVQKPIALLTLITKQNKRSPGGEQHFRGQSGQGCHAVKLKEALVTVPNKMLFKVGL